VSAPLWIAVGALGGAGAILRFVIDGVVTERLSREFPWGTFAVNVSGAFVLGLLAGASVGGRASLLAGTATVGAYTTFSTWMLESHRLGQDGERRLLLANLLVSLLVGFGAAELGHLVGGAL
jgi:CrcB protein